MGCDPEAGFPTDTRWLAITPNCTTTNIATDRASRSRSIFEFYRRLIALRHGSSEGSLGGETLMVMGNFSAESLELPHSLDGDLVLGNLVIGNSGWVPDFVGHCARGKCGWFGAGEIGPVRKQYQLGSFAGVRSGSAQLSQTNIADGILLCRFHHMLVHNNGWQILRDGAEYWLKPPVSEDPLQILRPMPSKSPALGELLSSRLVV